MAKNVAARLAALGLELPPVFQPVANYLGCKRAELGSLDRVRQIVEVFGMVNCAPGFNRTPEVIDGCSDLLVDVFGDAGRHTRAAVGMAELPFDIPVEIRMTVEVED